MPTLHTMAFNTDVLIFAIVGVIACIILVFGGCTMYRILTGRSMGTLRIVRDEKGEVVAMKTTL